MLDGLGTMLTIGMIAVVMVIIGVGYSVTNYLFIEDVKEVSSPVQPEIKLVTDGKTIDTVYVYRFK